MCKIYFEQCNEKFQNTQKYTLKNFKICLKMSLLKKKKFEINK